MIEIIKMTKKFNSHYVLDNFSAAFEMGSILCIVGPSGGGKTTLLRCLAGLEEPDYGEILIENKTYLPLKNKGEVGFIFQDFNLFPHLTVKDNLSLAPLMVNREEQFELESRIAEYIQLFNLEEHLMKYPSQLSGGQKQRVAIIRALLMNPKILCYDEPTSALDPSLVSSIGETIINLKTKNITQIVVTHDLIFAKKIADQIIEISAK